MRVASVGCFPEAWRRGSWHFQVASLQEVLQSSMDLLSVRFTLLILFLPEQAQRAAYAARGANRLVFLYLYILRSMSYHNPGMSCDVPRVIPALWQGMLFVVCNAYNNSKPRHQPSTT